MEQRLGGCDHKPRGSRTPRSWERREGPPLELLEGVLTP